MAYDVKKYNVEDEKQRERIATKNMLESFAFDVKSKSEEVLNWLDVNQVSIYLVCIQSLRTRLVALLHTIQV